MSLDTLLTAIIYITQAGLAGLGVYVSIKPQPEKRHNLLIVLFILFAVIGITAGILQQHINKIETASQQKKLNDDLIQSHLDQEFIKGKLSAIGEIIGKMFKSVPDPSVKQMASAIEKMAQSSSQTTIATNKQICLNTMDLVKRIHKFAYDRREKSNQIMNQQMNESRTAKTEQERHENWQKHTAQLLQQSNTNQYEFRTTLLGEAIYLKDELLKRLPSEPKPDSKFSHVFEHGSLAGVYPEESAADYLEKLSRKLCP
jgi:hypothetical protein